MSIELKREMTPEEFEVLPENIRAGWEPKGDNYVAVPDLQRVFDEQEADLAAIETQLDLKRQEYAAVETQLARAVTGRCIGQTMTAAGVKPGLMRAAEALFRERHVVKFDRLGEDEFETTVETLDGHVTLDDSVGRWLETEEGRAFLSPPRDNPVLH